MDKDTGRRRFRITIGPLGMSLAAAAVTAVAFAAVSLADSGSGAKGGSRGGAGIQTFEAPAPPAGGPGIAMPGANLSAGDRQKLDEFRQCMQESGAPGPPEPGKFDPSTPPKPPSAADQQKLQKAWEACKGKLPEDMQSAGPPELHVGGCAPPPGPPPQSGKNQSPNQDQSNNSSGSSSGSSS